MAMFSIYDRVISKCLHRRTMMIYKPDVHKMAKKNNGHRFTMVGVCNHDQTSGEFNGAIWSPSSSMKDVMWIRRCREDSQIPCGGFTTIIWLIQRILHWLMAILAILRFNSPNMSKQLPFMRRLTSFCFCCIPYVCHCLSVKAPFRFHTSQRCISQAALPAVFGIATLCTGAPT